MSLVGAPLSSRAKQIRFPSGDHCGRAAQSGGKLSCSFSVPSARLRQRPPSGVTQATHCPSRVKLTPSASMPPRYVAHSPEPSLQRTSSPDCLEPSVKTFRPSRLHTGTP